MHDYMFTTEVVRFAFMFGVAVSMLLYERRHLTTGSIVVPGYIATFLAMPLTIVATFVNAFVSYWIVNKLLRRWFLLYGRTKFTVLASISIVIQSLMLEFSPIGSWMWESNIKLMVGVGYVVPALIAHDMGRQGIKKTVKSVTLAGCIVAVPIALALAVNMPGVNDLAPLRGGGELAIEVGWIPIAVLLSAASAWGVARFWGLRSGGFMGAAFVAILLGDPWQVLVTGVLAVMTYILVTRFLMNSMILFGRRKFSAMLLVSASMSWILLWIGGELFGIGVQSHMDIGSLALTPLIVPGLLANDAQRTSPGHVIGGLSMATTFVLSATWWIQSVVEDRPLDVGWKISAVASAAVIFGRSIIEKAAERVRADAGRRGATSGEPAPAIEHDPWYSFAFASYHRWAALHNDAAAAAEQWLASMLGEPPALAVAGSPAHREVGKANELPHRDLPQRHLSPRQPDHDDATALPSAASDADATISRIRAAAQRALTAPAHTVREPVLPQRRKPTPQRRPGGQRRGEFDAVSIDLAQQAARLGRLDGVPNTNATDGVWTPAVASDATGSPLASPRPRLPLAGAPISEQSDAATTRAHQRAASDARSTSITHLDGSDQEADTTPFPS
jgi:poly-gamma-glutamate biosynthesis protein PgsC/CapC